MKISIPYTSDTEISLNIPDKNILFVVDRKKVPALTKLTPKITKMLRRPTSGKPLANLARSAKKVTIVADDISRATPTDEIIPPILDELNRAGVPDSRIQVLVALGTHRPMTDPEFRKKYGKVTVDRVKVLNHDYKDEASLRVVEKTDLGHPIKVNKEVVESDLVIGAGSIIPHCYAGWGGGGKIILPGVSGGDMLSWIHLTAGKTRPISKIPGQPRNVIRRNINRVAKAAGLRFIVNVVLNHEDKIARIFTGDPIKAFEKGVQYAKQVYTRKVPNLADIVIVSSFPASIDYWQSGKTLDYAQLAVKKRGTIILVSPCPEGISPSHPGFAEYANLGYERALERIERGEIKDLVAGAGALMQGQILEHAEVICVSDGLTKEDKRKLGFKPADSTDEALELAFRSQGAEAKVGVIKCGEIIARVSNRKSE